MGRRYLSTTIVIGLLLGTLPLGLIDVEGANVTDVRWGGTVGDRSGVLEIQVDGTTWGVVCDDGWSTEQNHPNAIVACRALGFSNGGRAVLDGSYGDGVGDFLLDDADCSADMTSLAQCLSAQGNDCDRSTDNVVALECNQVAGPDVTTFKPPATTKAPSGVISDNCQTTDSRTVQLIGITDSSGIQGTGYVKIKDPNSDRWGFVCDDGWDQNAASVVCRQLCFPTNYTTKPGIPAEMKVDLEADDTIILDEVRCTGQEDFLADCPSNNFADTNDCSIDRKEIAGVQCVEANFAPPSPPDPELECGGGVLKANFYRSRDSRLETKHLSVLNDPDCADVEKEQTTQFVSIIIPVDKCGTDVSRNGTHILYHNDIRYASTLEEGVITRLNTYRVSIQCAMPVDKVVTQRVQAVTQAVTENSDGVIIAGMNIYRSDSFQSPVAENPVRIPLGEFLNLAIAMEDYDPRLKLVVEDCLATPTGNTDNTRLTKQLFKDKCIEERTLSTYPINNFEFGFRFKPFKFVDYPLLYIQCDSIICLVDDVSSECDRTCNNTKPDPAASSSSSSGDRRKRSAIVQRKKMVSPAIFLYDPHQPGSDSDEDDIKIVIDVNDDDNNNNNNGDAATAAPTPPPQASPTTPPIQQDKPQSTSGSNPDAASTSTPATSHDGNQQQQTPPVSSSSDEEDDDGDGVTDNNGQGSDEVIAQNDNIDNNGNAAGRSSSSLSSSLLFMFFLYYSWRRLLL